MNTVIYARYSSQHQKEESIEGQIRVCKEYAEKNGMTIIENYIDRGISGTTDNRAEFQRMIKDSVKRQFAVVLVYKFDRFARDRYDSAHYKSVLKKNGAKLVSAQEHIPDSPEGIILESVLEGMAEYYSVELAQRVTRGLTERALKSKAVGAQTLLGYKISPDRYYVLDENAVPIVQKIFQDYDDGKRVCHIVADLNERGFKTARGKKFTADNVHRALRNIKYTGVYSFSGIINECGMPQIVTKEQFERVQKRMRKNIKTPGAAKAKERYLLSGKGFCGLCGEKLIGECGRSKKNTYYYYKCSKRKRTGECDKETVRKEYLETLVASLTADYLSSPEKIRSIAKKCVAICENEKEASSDLPMYQQQLKEVKQSLANILAAIEKGIFNDTTQSRILELESAQARLEIDIENCLVTRPTITEDQVVFMLSHFTQRDNLSEGEYAERLIDSFVHSVHLFEDKIIIAFNLLNQENSLEEAVFSLADELLTSTRNSSDIDGQG